MSYENVGSAPFQDLQMWIFTSNQEGNQLVSDILRCKPLTWSQALARGSALNTTILAPVFGSLPFNILFKRSS